jgi:endonuclease YncB( thermonuclease family)
VGVGITALLLVAALAAEVWLIGPLTEIRGSAVVHDGDTLSIAGERFRLDGVDAPEQEQPCTGRDGKAWACGHEASRRLHAFVAGREVHCRARATDRFGRGVAVCELADGQSLNSWLARSGWAVATGHDGTYEHEQADAKAAGLGIWAGTFETPSDWRARHPRTD